MTLLSNVDRKLRVVKKRIGKKKKGKEKMMEGKK